MLFKSQRSESDIIHDILVETKDGIKKTQLMYKANMSNTQLDRYLKKLIGLQIIEERKDNDCTLYCLTSKGEKVESIVQQLTTLLWD